MRARVLAVELARRFRHLLKRQLTDLLPVLDRERYGLDHDIFLESVEIAAIADPIPADGACIFTGRTAVYVGPQETFDDGAGHVLPRDMPMPVCDKTAAKLSALERPDIVVTESTFHYRGGGCC